MTNGEYADVKILDVHFCCGGKVVAFRKPVIASVARQSRTLQNELYGSRLPRYARNDNFNGDFLQIGKAIQ